MQRLLTCALLLGLLGCGESSRAGEAFDAGHGGLDARVMDDAQVALDAEVPDAQVIPDAGGFVDARTPDEAGADAAVPDGAAPEDAALPEPLAWESALVTTNDGAIIIEKVSYRSEGLLITGQVCRPTAAGPHPVQIVNHGGFSGVPAWNGGNCASLARSGWVVAESSYRGEDESEGAIEVCQGEVTDVLRMTDIVLAQPYADAARVLMSGTSHGGCITLRAVQRGAPVQAAVDIFGPTDWAAAYAMWSAEVAAGSLLTGSYLGLMTTLEQATGGTPDEVPEAYAERSPVTYAAALQASTVPLLVLQAGSDAYVPNPQACALAVAAPPFHSLHVTAAGTVVASAPLGCEASGVTWQSGPRPTTEWPASPYLIVYDDVGHGFEGAGTAYLLADLTAFASAFITP